MTTTWAGGCSADLLTRHDLDERAGAFTWETWQEWETWSTSARVLAYDTYGTLYLRLYLPDGSYVGLNLSDPTPVALPPGLDPTQVVPHVREGGSEVWWTPPSSHLRSSWSEDGNRLTWAVDDSYGDGDWNDLVFEISRHTIVQHGAWIPDPDLSAALVSWSIDYGRTPSTAATVVLAEALTPTTPELGDRARLALAPDLAEELGLTDTTRARFLGEVTDVKAEPRRGIITATLVGRLARQARAALTGHWPSETDGARAARILARIGAHTGTVDPGTVAFAAADPSQATALQLLERAAAGADARLLEHPEGLVAWQDAEHRRGMAPAAVLPAAAILSDLTWDQRVGDIINRATVTTDDGTTVTVDDPVSIDHNDRGVYPVKLDTDLAAEVDAIALASSIVGRASMPVWQLPDLTVDLVRSLPAEDLADVVALRSPDRVTVTDLPAGPYTGDHNLIVEGWAESATRRAWRLSLRLSDPARSGVSLRWVDVDPALAWDDVDPALTWLDLAVIEDTADLWPPVDTGGTAGTTTWTATETGGTAGTTSWDTTTTGGTA